MPRMRGLDFLEKAKEICPSVVTIYTCGCDILYEDQLCKSCGFVDEFLPAPVARSDLILEIKVCIRVSETNKNSVKGKTQ